MATRSDSGECFGQEKTSLSQDDFAEDSLKIVSLPPVEKDYGGEISPKKQVKSSPFTSVSEKDGEIAHADSVEVSFSETSLLLSKEPDAMDVDCPAVFSVPEAGSASLEEERIGEQLKPIKETFAANISEISTEGDQFGDDVHKMEEEGVETDGSVVCISEIQGVKESLNSEKKGQDSDVQRLLEAEKRRLLAEIEVGTIFRIKDDVGKPAMASDSHKIEKNGNGNGSEEQHEKMERVSVKDNAFVGRSVKIDLVDDTALLNVVPFSKKGKDHPKRPGTAHAEKDTPRKHKKTGEKPIGGKQDKGSASNVVEGNASTKLSETNGKQLRIMYTRNQMKSMRNAQSANQKKLWSDMYARLPPELVTEYEGLVSLKNQKTSKSNLRDSGIDTKEGMDDLTLEEEEDYTEDNDDYNSILKPAFAVDGEPDFDSGPPEDGLEYLRRVRWEAKRVPNVKVAKLDGSKYRKKEQSVYMPQIPEIHKCPEHLLPVKEWEDSLLSDFLQLRLALSQDANKYCEDETMSSQSIEDVLMEILKKRLHTVTDESFGEVVSDIQGMDSVTRVSKLKKRICLVEKESGLQSSDFKWIVALCASVDTPLDADTCACLRALLRKCASLRALEVEDEQVIIMANMLITIAGRYFGQME
ncbi:uncharacterized protein LOC18026444 isoform X2 [Eutrema salsugineum]|uniref:uncharacterized protein LOC18026444 isoform X2 n=1 Tax=Eutrema salsugineum TaxID=72664 RepID=UPI000CED1798|nr:uncharacterized protein LOC18026444 isoform X2 [Eutrema salsugineum]